MGCQSSLEASVDRRRAERYAKQKKTSELRNQREKKRDSLRRSSSFTTDRSRSNSCNSGGSSGGGAGKSLLTKKSSSKWFGSSGSLHRAPRRESSVVTFEGNYEEDEENSPRKRRSSSVHFIDLDGPEESYEFSPRYHDDSSPRQSFQYNFFSGGVGNTSLNKHITQRKSLVISTANDQPKESQEEHELISSPRGRERQRSDSVASPRGVPPKKQLSEIDQWVLTDDYATTAEFENSLRRTASERAMNESQRCDSAERCQTAPKQLSFNSTSSAGLSTTNSVLSANQISVSGGSSVGNRSHSTLSSLMRKPNTSSTNHPMDDKEAEYSGDGDLLGFITNSIPTPKGSLADQQNNNSTFLVGSRSLNNLSTSSQTSRSQTGGVVGGGGGATAGLAVVMGSSMRSASPCDDSSLCSSSTPHFFEGIPKAILSSTKTPEILALPQTTPHQAPSSSSSLLQPPLHSLPPTQVAERILQDDDRSFVHDLETVDAAQRKQ